MLESISNFVTLTFVVTTFTSIGFLYFAIRQSSKHRSIANKTLATLISWAALQMILALNYFYANTTVLPPRLFAVGVLPSVVVILLLFNTKKGKGFIDDLPLRTLTYLSVIRVPVELVLYWLFLAGTIPEIMTFSGVNFDIIAGITAPIIAFLYFQKKKLNKSILLVWNILMLGLLINIVVHATLSTPFSFQQLAFDQPNIAILYFPMIWLPTIVVPIVMLSHFISIRRLLFSASR